MSSWKNKTTGEASKYEKKSPMEHVLLRPDTYIGGVGLREDYEFWTFDKTLGKMTNRNGCYPPGLLKIFDEILVNSADNKTRDETMNRLEVSVDRETSRITVWNNGKGLPIEMHPTEGVYVPTLIFGNLFTSSNYDDNVIKTVGGRNGYGAKLCNIFSREFIVETVDSSRRLKFRQRWFENMQKFDEPQIEPVDENATDFTKVEFVPDLARFQLTSLTDDIISLIQRRVYDVAATLQNGVRVVFNGDVVALRDFDAYVKSYVPEGCRVAFFHPNSRWHVAVVSRQMSQGDGDDMTLPHSISFVNNINTEKGGTHVEHVSERIVSNLKKMIDLKLKNATTTTSLRVKPATIRTNLAIFINSLIENPSFESQTKETLTTKPKFFGSSFEVDTEKLKNWAEESGFIEDIVEIVLNEKKRKPRENKKSISDVRNIVKLEDATWAGTKDKSNLCTLIVTEGDSAKALALAGLEILGRDKFGVFPLKGKLVNVSNLDELKTAENEEISTLMRILGLSFGMETWNDLRYGKMMILADQDEDGSHIKGLVINFIHRFWPDLLKNGFIESFRTPLLKAKRGKEVVSFFTNLEYRKWAQTTENADKYNIKYYKGLGTSTSAEARQYFSDLQHHVINFKYNSSEDDEAIRMAFDRDKSDERKSWIKKFDENSEENQDEDKNEMSYKEFIDGDLMKFGIVDLRRSIPCIVDGLKPSQRKILWTLLTSDESSSSSSREMKVSQLAGAVSHSQSYHHGEESLVRTIIRMAQRFCGASNVNLLEPIGQFGTRHEGGNDAASARYIFTGLASPTRLLFPPADNALLSRRIEDGQIVEPEWLCPIIPIVLVNGAEGIGTGWSTRILNRNIFEIINMTRRMIEKRGENSPTPLPMFEEFSGKIDKLCEQSHRFVSRGNIRVKKLERKNSSSCMLEINELPVGVWTSKYKEKLQRVLEDYNVINFTEHHTEKRVKFQISLDRKKCNGLLQKTNAELLKIFKLSSTMTENLVLFNSSGKLHEYQTINEIAREFFEIRGEMYKKRREIQILKCEERLDYVKNQMRFIEHVTNGTIDLRNTNKIDLQQIMRNMNFSTVKNKSDFGYLLEMPLSRLTPEEMTRLFEKNKKREKELDEIRNSRTDDIWMSELDRLEHEIIKYRES